MVAQPPPKQHSGVSLVDVLGEFLNAPLTPAPGPQPSRHALISGVELCLRGIGQVVFMNHPLCGLLVLAGMALQSWRLALFTLLGVAAGTAWARWKIDDRPGIEAGIYGYNAALIGAAAATFGQMDSLGSTLAWGAMTVLFAALSSALLHRMGGWLVQRGIPSLTLPFCLLTLACLSLVGSLALPGLSLAPSTGTAAETAPPDLMAWLSGAGPVGFGQVFFVGHWLGGAAGARRCPDRESVGCGGWLIGGTGWLGGWGLRGPIGQHPCRGAGQL